MQLFKFSGTPVGFDSLTEPVPARIRVALDMIALQDTLYIQADEYQLSSDELSARNAALETIRNYLLGEITAKEVEGQSEQAKSWAPFPYSPPQMPSNIPPSAAMQPPTSQYPFMP